MASFEPEGATLTYRWSFGDGSSVASGPEVSHTFSQAGQYPVTLTVADENGFVGTGTVIITVFNADFPNCHFPTTLDLTGETLDSTATYEACSTITVGPGVSITPTGDVTFRAGEAVTFGDNFSVEASASFRVVLDSELSSP